MKQLLLRVPEDLHRRLTARAARESRSVNAVATEILDAAADADSGDRATQVRARAAALGMLQQIDAEQVSDEQRTAILNSFRGIGAQVDRLIDEDRGRL